MTAYVAKGVLRNGHTNSILASSPARKLVAHRQCAQFRKRAQPHIIYVDNTVRLSALFNKQPRAEAPLIILLHGWLGCADSLYLLSLGSFLFDHGYHVVRLNLRDHGDSHHLNEEMFHSCRIQEVIDACIQIQTQFPQSLLSMAGFSLGGNFALRVNAFTTPEQLPLHRTIAFCPVMSPMNTLFALENSFLVYRNYFMQRWRTAFFKKAAAFPEVYNKETFKAFRSLREATADLATQYAGFDSLDAYLNGYAITENRLSTLHAPSHIVLAQDDPIIPWRDQTQLAANQYLTILNTEHGGHCGFLAPDLTSPWINQFVLDQLES